MLFSYRKLPSWEYRSLLGQRPVDETSDADEKETDLPQNQATLSRLNVSWALAATCYSVFATIVIVSYLIRSRFPASSLSYSEREKCFQAKLY